MKYKIVITDGIPSSIFRGEELPISDVASVNFVGKKDCHVRITLKNGEEIHLKKDQVDLKYQ